MGAVSFMSFIALAHKIYESLIIFMSDIPAPNCSSMFGVLSAILQIFNVIAVSVGKQQHFKLFYRFYVRTSFDPQETRE